MPFTIKNFKDQVSWSDINNLASCVGWGDLYYSTADHWQQTLTKSTHIAYIKENEELIAFARILEDGQMCMFYDVCVHPHFQKKGLGTAIMNHLIENIKDKNYVSLGLFVWQGNKSAAEFYSKFGFEQAFAMELKKHMKKV